ncbi:MAG: bacillithiol system redox-active protein YtxJ [Cellulophaga fucicola]
MGLFTGLFGGNGEKKEEKQLPWIPLTAVEQLKDIEEKSKTKTQIIFKHSTSCGISRMVIKMFRDTYDYTEEQADLYYLDLLQYREVSNETGYKFQVMHQSPQLLVVKNGVAVANASHGSINELHLEKYI